MNMQMYFNTLYWLTNLCVLCLISLDSFMLKLWFHLRPSCDRIQSLSKPSPREEFQPQPAPALEAG